MTVMTRLTITILIILGLMFQPFGSVVSAKRIDGDMDHSVMSMDMDDPLMAVDEDAAQAPCHEAADDTADDLCNECCGVVCSMINHCVASIVPFAVNQSTRHLWPEHSVNYSIPNSVNYTDRSPTFIYHPPRLS